MAVKAKETDLTDLTNAYVECHWKILKYANGNYQHSDDKYLLNKCISVCLSIYLCVCQSHTDSQAYSAFKFILQIGILYSEF